MQKQVVQVFDAPQPHWVGDGFPVQSVLSQHAMGDAVSPFLLLDYAAPYPFPPSEGKPGVGAHPHKGFETVTIMFQGELEHADSSGNRGSIGPGDVQWMTAGSGLLHEEFHSANFARSGGTFEVAQLWVNLPARFKSHAPRYQTLMKADIPVVELPDGAGKVRVIAGEYSGKRGPAQTFTRVQVWDGTLNNGHRAEFSLPDGDTAMLLVLRGELRLNDEYSAGASQLVLLERDGETFSLEAHDDSRFLLLGGEPIDEPVAWYGPFVMNTQQEIQDAIAQFRAGGMGNL